jgi:hypothetical protein
MKTECTKSATKRAKSGRAIVFTVVVLAVRPYMHMCDREKNGLHVYYCLII